MSLFSRRGRQERPSRPGGFRKPGSAGSSRFSASKGGIQRPSFLERITNKKTAKEEAGGKPEKSIFNKAGHTSGKKLGESLFSAHAEVYKKSKLYLDKKKTLAEYFDKPKSHYSKQDIRNRISALEKEKQGKQDYEKKPLNKQIETLKKASGL